MTKVTLTLYFLDTSSLKNVGVSQVPICVGKQAQLAVSLKREKTETGIGTVLHLACTYTYR